MASLSVEQVDQQIRERKTRRAALDKQIVELQAVRAVILKYGRNGTSRNPVPHQKEKSRRVAPNSTGLKHAVVGLSLPPKFDVKTVVEALRAKHFDFGKRDPKAAVRDCLYGLADEGLLRVIEQGTGGRQSTYEIA